MQTQRERRFSIDVGRTNVHKKFFDTFDFKSQSDLFQAVRTTSVDLRHITAGRDSSDLKYSGWVHWFLFLKGYLEFRELGDLLPGNVFLRYISEIYVPRGYDPGLTHLACSTAAHERVLRRFRVVEALADSLHDPVASLDPITVFARVPPLPSDRLVVVEVAAKHGFFARLLDGHHRLFAARLFDLDSAPAILKLDLSDNDSG